MADLKLSVLDEVRIASPCSMKWDDLEGTDRVRHCGACDLNVYNLSDMTRGEAERLIVEHEGRLCGTFHRRVDGTILTRDCPVGFRALRRRTRMMWARVAAGIGLLVTTACAMAGVDRATARLRTRQPFATICHTLAPAAPPALGVVLPMPPGAEMGRMAMPRVVDGCDADAR